VSALRVRPVLSLVGCVLLPGFAAACAALGGSPERAPATSVSAPEATAAALDAPGLPFEGLAWASPPPSGGPLLGRAPVGGTRRGSTDSARTAATPVHARTPGLEELRPAHLAADALARAGTLSAPSTAPPTLHRW
jgi:hypothetical protein